MAAPVWLLSVDLTTKTTSFTTGLADAAKQARGSFRDIGGGAAEMSDRTAQGFGNVRASIGLLDNAIRGAHAQAMADIVREFAQTRFMMAALPFAATAGGILLVAGLAAEAAKKFQEWREEQAKLAGMLTTFHTSLITTFDGLEDKLTQVEEKADDLSGNHLAALQKQLVLIDHQSMTDLVHAFNEVAKSAETTFGQLKSTWYTFGIGSAGAQNALEQFKTAYESLLVQHEDKKASDLLAGTLASAQKVLTAQETMKKQGGAGLFGPDNTDASFRAQAVLRQAGVGYTQKEVESQKALVDALQAQIAVEQEINKIKVQESSNATTSTRQQMKTEADKAAKEKAEQAAKMAQAQAGFDQELYQLQLNTLQQSERDKISATEEGSASRLAAISAAMREEESQGLQETTFYHSLLAERNQLIREMAAEQLRIRESANQEDIANTLRMGEIQIAAEKQNMMLENSTRRVSLQQQIAVAVQLANEEYSIRMAALQKEVAGLDKSGNDYANRLKQLYDKEKQLTQQHENEVTAIRETADIRRNQSLLASTQQFNNAIAQGLTASIMGHQTWSRMILSLGDQVVGGMINNAIKSMMADDMTKEKDAAFAARKAFGWGWEHGGAAAPVLAPVLAGAAFASAMAFAKGTDRVPGVGHGDTVPAMLTPGEGVVPGGVMDGLRNVARNGGFQQQPHMTVHVAPVYHVQTIDGDGMQAALEKHSEQLQQHFENTLRKMNH